MIMLCSAQPCLTLLTGMMWLERFYSIYDTDNKRVRRRFPVRRPFPLTFRIDGFRLYRRHLHPNTSSRSTMDGARHEDSEAASEDHTS